MNVLKIVKANLGLSLNNRDDYLMAIIKGAEREMKNEGIILIDKNKEEYQLYLADYSAWLYRSRSSDEPLPKHLELRRNNLILLSELSNEKL